MTESVPKKYLKGETLEEIIQGYPIMRKGLPPRDVEREMYNRQSFLDFLKGLLNLNPFERWSPLQAIQHPFITGEPFTCPYIPSEKTRYQHLSGKGRISDMGPGKSVISMFQSRRPRANTISSSKVQNVPPQLKSLVAAQQLQGSNIFPHPEAADRMRDLPLADGSPMPDYVSNPGTYIVNSSSDTADSVRRNSNSQIQSYPMKSQPSYSSDAPKMDPSVYVNSQASTPFEMIQNANVGDPQIQFYQDSGTNSTNTSFERFTSEVLPAHGSTGERSHLPSRIPSSATSAEWEMFDDLDTQGPFYSVSGGSSLAASRQGSMMDMSTDYNSYQGNTYMSLSNSFTAGYQRNDQSDVALNSGESRGSERKYSIGSNLPVPQPHLSISSGSSRRNSFSQKHGGKTPPDASSSQYQKPSMSHFDSKRHSVNQEYLTQAYQQKRYLDSNPTRRSRRATHYDNPTQNSGLIVGPSNDHNIGSMPESVNVRPPVTERRRYSDLLNPQYSVGAKNNQTQNNQYFASNGSSAENSSCEHQHDN